MTHTTETKRIPAVSAETNAEAGTLRLDFANGEAITLHISELSRAIIDQAILHGLKQKLVDAAAISRNPDTGRSATVADKFAAVYAVYQRLVAGEWNAARGEGGTGSGGLLFRALCAVYADKDPAMLREWLAGKSRAEQAALRKNAKVAAAIAEIQAASSTADADELLGELDELGD